MRCLFSRNINHAGSALLAVLWVIALLSFLVVTTMMIIMQDVESVAARHQVQRARQLAEMGLAVAAHPSIQSGDPLLERQVAPMEGYRTIISTEESRLNINALLKEEGKQVLQRVFHQVGLELDETDRLIQRLQDWIDSDDLLRQDGMERDDYLKLGRSGQPYNRPFRDLQEMELVPGMEQLTALWPEWKNNFTVHGDGRLDVNEASPWLIAMVTGASLAAAEEFAARRHGLDGIHHTLDDTPYEDMEEVLRWLGSGGLNQEQLQQVISLKGRTKRIESTGYSGDYSRTLLVVMRDVSGQPNLLDWRESSPND